MLEAGTVAHRRTKLSIKKEADCAAGVIYSDYTAVICGGQGTDLDEASPQSKRSRGDGGKAQRAEETAPHVCRCPLIVHVRLGAN